MTDILLSVLPEVVDGYESKRPNVVENDRVQT